MNTKERLIRKLEFVQDTGCWEFRGYKDACGYGRMMADGKSHPAHRVAYEIMVGPIPEGLELDHLCRNPACCNPSHLDPVTHRTNLMRGNGACARNARKTHCPKGHEYTPENTRTPPSGGRWCLACERERSKRRSKGGIADAAKTHCPAGHPYSGENLRIDTDGGRRCRACESQRKKTAYQKRRSWLAAEALRWENP